MHYSLAHFCSLWLVLKKRLDFKFIHSKQQKACYFPTALPLWVVARPLGSFRCRAENAWTEAVKPLGSSTRLPIHTLSICLFAVNIPILQSFHVVSKLILSHTHKKSPLEDFQYPNSSNSFPFSLGQCLKPRHGQQHPQMTTLPPSSAPSLGLCPVFRYLSSSSIVTLNF